MENRKRIPIYAVLILTALILAALIPFCSAAAENLLKNGDFKNLDNEGLPAEWYTDAYIQEPGYSVFGVEEGDPDHPMAVTIENIGENDARFAQTVEVEPDTLYRISGYIRAEGVEDGHGANFSVEGIYAFSEPVYETEGEWIRIDYYGETGPEQRALTVFARLGGYSGVSTGKAWFADLSLTETDSVPGNGIADRWYREDYEEYDSTEDDGEDSGSDTPFRGWLIVIGLAYTCMAAFVIRKENKRQITDLEGSRIKGASVATAMLLSLILRLVICWFVEGYMVDVNCFLSWGRTMAAVGPASFYEATSFCDYPPLYTYILALNSIVSDLFGNSAAVSRVAFRMIPCLCDLGGCWMVYRLMIRTGLKDSRRCFLFLLFALFNPATILNSAGWGQMDSVLCLLLLCVALLAVDGKWTAALPLYVVAALVKPQALMLGPLGLAFIVLTWVRDRNARKSILSGAGISVLTLLAGVIPFSLRQDWDWIIQLYARTLGSYPYATVNTANFYYILGGNWAPVERSAHVLAPALLGAGCLCYGIWWLYRVREVKHRTTEAAVSFAFAAAFTVMACTGASWAVSGFTAMAFAFVIVLSSAVRSGEIRTLPWLGGLLFILLYVFGVKMHERYVFPALLLLAAAWTMYRDKRILCLLLLFSLTVFLNEGIVLDNSIRLGSGLGHLNADTEALADVISVMNMLGAVYAVWLNTEILYPGRKSKARTIAPRTESDWKCDRGLYWQKKDTVLMLVITAIYAAVSLLTLGSGKAPQTVWSSSSPAEEVIFDLGEKEDGFEILYFAQVSRNHFSFSVSDDGENWSEETWAQMDQGQCWKWKYVTDSFESGDGSRTFYSSDESHIIRFSGRYVRLNAHQLGLKLNEILFRDANGTVLQVTVHQRNHAAEDSELYSDPAALIDEQDTMEGLPALPQTQETAEARIQPSWWNSSYFDEIYHARTAYEFTQGTVPYETSHPPLGKVLMSWSVSILGMTPFGWRFAGAVAGILMLPGMYLLGKQMTKKTRIAALMCGMMALDCLHLTQTQIATIDSFPVLFIIFAYYFMLRFLQTDFVKEKLRVSLLSLGFSGLFMGLSIASKWIGIYAGAGLGILFFWHCIRVILLERTRSNQDGTPGIAVRKVLILCAWCVLFFVAVPVLIYLVSYIPYLAYNAKKIHGIGDYISEVWRAQVGMFNYHSTPNLGMDHPFYSPWWEWPVIGKPMYYASEQYLPDGNPVHHSIFAFGNPVIWYGALAALAICLLRALYYRRYRLDNDDPETVWHLIPQHYDVRYMFTAVGLLAQYLPWVLVPRGTYIYHYFASIPFLMAAIGLCFDPDGERSAKAARICTWIFIACAAVFFVILFPYASGMNVSAEWLDIGKKILHIWY